MKIGFRDSRLSKFKSKVNGNYVLGLKMTMAMANNVMSKVVYMIRV